MKKNTVQFQLDYLARNLDHVLARLTDIESRLSRLEVFTGMVAPAPFPAAEDAAPLVTFQAGEVGYSDNPETPQLNENGDLYY